MLATFIDIETTGLDFEADRITEIGAVLADTDKWQPLQLVDHLIDIDGFKISADITELTGIDNDLLKRCGIPFELAIMDVQRIIAKGEYVIAHNGTGFDRPFLEKQCALHTGGVFTDRPWIDSITDIPYPDTFKTRKLTYLAAEHGFLNPFAHRAVFDCLTALKIMSNYPFSEVVRLQQSPTVRVVAKNLPFSRKDEAKDLGFYWDGEKKVWFKNFKQIHVLSMSFPFEIEMEVL